MAALKPVSLGHKIKLLNHVGLGDKLSDEELKLLAEIAEREVHLEGTCIIQEDSMSRDVYLLEEGKVSIRVTHPSTPDKEEVVHCLRSGQIFGELALVDGSRRSASVEVDVESVVYKFQYDMIMQLMDNNPRLGYKLMRNIAAIIADRVRNTTMMWRCTLIW